MRETLRRTPVQSLRALTISLLLTSAMAASASQVTTERILGLPDYSASSDQSPATLSNSPLSSGKSGVTLDSLTAGNNPVTPADGESAGGGETEETVTVSDISYDIDTLPKPVANMHSILLEAAKSGDLANIREAIEMNELPPIIGFDGSEGTPIDQFKSLSGDPDGAEIMAILAEVLEAGFVLQDEGTPQAMYVWPYFAAKPLNKLTATQKVELFRLITAGDYEEMQALGHYSFFRLGLGPDGTWHYFMAGD